MFECSDPFKASFHFPPVPDPALRALCLPESEKGIEDDLAVFKPVHLLDRCYLSRLIPHSRHMHHDIHRRRDLTPDRRKRQICRHQHHRFQACEHVFYTVRMTAGKAAVMARVETLQKIQRLFSAHLANDNPVRPQYKKVNVK